ncbi:hypothetical protein ACFOOJ_03750, partial [Sphingobium xenophagum]|uniref:hypothetical protein n=1 Tax=Sphingobium xenophagum TaxID=121428 RepID=UPI003617486C
SKSPTNTLQHHSFHAASIRTVDPTRKSSGSSRCPIFTLTSVALVSLERRVFWMPTAEAAIPLPAKMEREESDQLPHQIIGGQLNQAKRCQAASFGEVDAA